MRVARVKEEFWEVRRGVRWREKASGRSRIYDERESERERERDVKRNGPGVSQPNRPA